MPRKRAPFFPGAVILAAGASSRMGQPKQLLPWGKTTILGHIVETWRNLRLSQVCVVFDPKQKPVRAELDRLQVSPTEQIPNPNAEQGMFSSIHAAARWQGWELALTHFVIVLGDQPQFGKELLGAFLEFASRHPQHICQPSHGFKGRHPVVLPKQHFLELGQASCATLKDFLRAHRMQVRLLEWTDENLGFDIDTPEDYERARQRFGG